MKRSEFIDELTKLIKSGEITTIMDLQIKTGASRSKIDNQIKAGEYSKIKIFKNFILIKN